MIQVQNLSKLYGTHVAVDDISFKVKKGHIYGLLGPNGAGKSTTMNIITGYIAPTLGTVTINGHELGKETLAAKKCIGYLPENPPLYQDMFVKEYLEFVAKLKKTDKAKRAEEIETIMSQTGLSAVSGRLIKNLSKGYKQRVGIAQALLGSPEIVILDEPTVGLDPEQIIEIRTLIKSLKKKHTVILSSHILSEISAVCDDVLMIAKGKVVAMDTTENILKKNQGGQRITITVKGQASKAEEVLKQLKGLESFKLVSEKNGQATFEIEAKQTKTDVREEISFALSDARILIIEMNVSKASLEDVYLDILQECREAEAEDVSDVEASLAENDESDDTSEETDDNVEDDMEANESEDNDAEGGEE